MITELITDGIWAKITKAVRQNAHDCRVAVAYLGTGAAERMPLESGSVLVVDLSEESVKSLRTHPGEVIKFLKRDVEVHSLENLHAKVFACGAKKAFVGSSNVSNNAANNLIEAVIETDKAGVVAACREFVESQEGEPISIAYAKELLELYKKAKKSQKHTGKNHNGHARRNGRIHPLHKPVWIVPLVNDEWDQKDYDKDETEYPKAQEKIQKLHGPKASRNFRIEKFLYTGARNVDKLKRTDMAIQIIGDGPQKHSVSPVGRIIHFSPKYKGGHSTHRLFYVEIPKYKKSRRLGDVTQKLKCSKKSLFYNLAEIKQIKDPDLGHRLLNLMGGEQDN